MNKDFIEISIFTDDSIKKKIISKQSIALMEPFWDGQNFRTRIILKEKIENQNILIVTIENFEKLKTEI